MNITVKYSCHTCQLTKVPVLVPARGNEDVATWMDQTIQWLADDHRKRSPMCVPLDGKLHDIMIPIDGVEKIGGPPVQ